MKQLFRALIASLVVFLAVPGGARAGQADPFHKEGRGKLSYELDRIARESERGGQVKSMSPAYNRAKGTVTVVIELNAGASPDAIKSIVQAAGGRVDGVAGNLVKATMAPGVLRDVAAQPDVRFVRAPYRPTVKKAGRVGAGFCCSPSNRICACCRARQGRNDRLGTSAARAQKHAAAPIEQALAVR